jgi:hypothetical protein
MEPRKHKRIKLRNNPMRPLSEKEIVDATIAFANGATLELLDLYDPFDNSLDRIEAEIQGTESKLQEPCVGDQALEKREIRIALETGKEPRAVQLIREDRRRATRENLWHQIHDTMSSGDIEEWSDEWSDMDLFPLINPKPYMRKVANGLTLSFFYSFATDLDLVTLGEFLLMDTERPFGKKLCQCELQSCGLFFFEVKPPTGRPQRKYCCAEHMLKAHDQNASKRMKRKRSKTKDRK